MVYRWLIFAIAAAVAPLACGSAATSARSCGVADLHAVPIPRPAIERTLRLPPGDLAGHMAIVSGHAVRGRCANAIRAYFLGNAIMSNGRVIAVSEHADRPAPGRTFDEAELITNAAAVPRIAGHRFVTAVRIAYRQTPRGLETRFLGIWGQGGRSVVSSFARQPDGRYTVPRPVLYSTLPLRSIRYLPSPDTSAGRVDIIQDGSSGEKRLVALDLQPGASR